MLKNFLNERGQIKNFPSKRKNKILVLEYLGEKFEKNRIYSESEIDEIINQYHLFGDSNLLRRELYEIKLLNRSLDCKKYWLEKKEKN